MANVFRRLDYTFAGSDEPAISLGQIGELVDGFRRQIDLIGEAREISDEKLLGQIRSLGMDEVRVTASMDSGNRSRYYVAGKTSGQGMVLSRTISNVVNILPLFRRAFSSMSTGPPCMRRRRVTRGVTMSEG